MRLSVSFRLAVSFLGVGGRRGPSNARKSLYGAIAGIGISLVPLIVVMVISDGMIEGITARLIDLSTAHIRVIDYSGEAGFDQGKESLESTLKVQRSIEGQSATALAGLSATHIVAERQGTALIVSRNGRVGGTIRAVDPTFFSPSHPARRLLTVVEGSLDLAESRGAVIGKRLAQDLSLHPGDTFRVLTMRRAPAGNSVPRFTPFTVTGIVSSGYQELDALWVFIPFTTGVEILPGESSSTFLSITTDAPFGAVGAARDALLASLPEGFDAYTWKELNRSQFHSFTTTRTLLVFIMFLILFVAAVNISSALVMLVMERRREIAILKSVGADPACITYAFLLSGFFTGFGGILIGMPIGLLLAVNINEVFSLLERVINATVVVVHSLIGFFTDSPAAVPEILHLLDPEFYLETIPVTVSLGQLFHVAAGALLLSVLVSIVPSIRAGREKPLDTLRKV